MCPRVPGSHPAQLASQQQQPPTAAADGLEPSIGIPSSNPPQVCIGDNASANATMGPAVPAPTPEAAPMASAAATAALVPAATLLLAVVAQLLLA